MCGRPSAFRQANIEISGYAQFLGVAQSVLALDGSAKRFRTSAGIAVSVYPNLFEAKLRPAMRAAKLFRSQTGLRFEYPREVRLVRKTCGQSDLDDGLIGI